MAKNILACSSEALKLKHVAIPRTRYTPSLCILEMDS